ncbi:MAG: metallophosphoesterase family protein [Terriglobales bacterium]
MINIGVISDTHGLLRPEAVAALRGSDHIVHAGDIGSPEILAQLQLIAPVYAIRGNVDVEPWANAIPVTRTVELGGRKFYLIHNRAELKKTPLDVAAVIFGHSHQPLIENRGEVLYFNPGSAGPRRFKLPISLGKIRIDDGLLHPELIPLLA